VYADVEAGHTVGVSGGEQKLDMCWVRPLGDTQKYAMAPPNRGRFKLAI
jgi:hypothetical protein